MERQAENYVRGCKGEGEKIRSGGGNGTEREETRCTRMKTLQGWLDVR